MTEEKILELQDLLSRLQKEGGYFLDFLKIRNLEAGIILLHPDENDTQGPHPSDELYYIINGSGWMDLGKTKRAVKEGSIIFVPAGMRHKFYGNKEDLVILYVFAD